MESKVEYIDLTKKSFKSADEGKDILWTTDINVCLPIKQIKQDTDKFKPITVCEQFVAITKKYANSLALT